MPSLFSARLTSLGIVMLSVSERTFNQAVLESPQPVLVHFCAPWCSLCRLIEPLLFKFQGETEGRLKLARVNVDANFRLVSRYRLKSLPTLILFEGGAIACRVEAIQGRDDLQQQLQAIGSGSFPPLGQH